MSTRKSKSRTKAKPLKVERPRLVKNPVHLTEDEADAIISLRRLESEGDGIDFEEYLHKHGLKLER